MVSSTRAAIDAFLGRWVNLHLEAHGELPTEEPDPEAPSPCFVDAEGHWRPVPREPSTAAPIGGIHPSAQIWLDAYWRLTIEVRLQDQWAALSPLASEWEREQTVEGVTEHRVHQAPGERSVPIGHVFDGRSLAITDDGAVVLEAPGERRVVVAASLEELLSALALTPSCR